jgi:chromosomal replication initiation ATPase DnaA
MHLLRSRFEWSYERIGSVCGGRDHGTVMHGIATLRDRRTQSRVLQLIAAACERDLDQHLSPHLVAA